MKPAIFFAALFVAAPAFAQPMDAELISECAPCHGADGISKFGEVPNLAGQNEPYPVNQLRAFHTRKRPQKELGYMSHDLGSVWNQDSHLSFDVIQAKDGPIRFN